MRKGSAIRWLLAGWVVLAVALAKTAFAGVVVRDIQLAGTPEGQRLVLSLSGKTADRVFKLSHPDRIVIDLPETVLSPGVRAPAGSGIVNALRLGPQPKHTLRLVVELNARIAARTSWSRSDAAPGYRLTLNLGGSGEVASRTNTGGASGAGTTPALRSPAGVSDTAPAPARAPVRPAHAPVDTGRDVVVAVDAGHGGDDPGAIGGNGTREKDVVLGIARVLAERIDNEPGMHAVLTRDGDYFVALRERIRRARTAKADLFVSIHADSVLDRAVSGASVYVLSEKGATNEAARWLAERENAADLKGGVKLDDKDNVLASVLLDLSQSASIGSSTEAAERVLAALDRIGDVRKPRVQQAGFVVLKSPDIPSMLVETAYISNPADEHGLGSEAHQRQLAAAIFSGVRRYFEDSPPDGTRFALRKRAPGEGMLAAGTDLP